MDLLYVGIIATVVVIAIVIATFAFTGNSDISNPLTVDNLLDFGSKSESSSP